MIIVLDFLYAAGGGLLSISFGTSSGVAATGFGFALSCM